MDMPSDVPAATAQPEGNTLLSALLAPQLDPLFWRPMRLG